MKDFETLKEWVQTSWRAQGDWREAVEEDFNFVDGHQWTDSEKTALEEQSRIPIVFNRTAVIIGSVAGTEINNRTEVRFIPREIGDVKPNEVLTAGGEWFRDQADAEDAESDAFQDLLMCGLAVTDTGLDWDKDPEGEPEIRKIDPCSFGWDHYAYNKGLTDARYFFEVVEKPKGELEDRFEGKDASEIDADWLPRKSDTGEGVNHAGDEYAYEDNNDIEENKASLHVVRIQWRERSKVVEFINPETGKRDEMDAKKFKILSERVPLNIPQRTLNKWVWHQAFLGKNDILEKNQPDPDGSTFNVMTGHWDRKDKRFYGLLRSMKDPQKFANKWLSQTLHIINSNSKGGVMVEPGAVVDQQQFEESWAAADGVTWMKDGAIAAGRISEKPKADMPSALMSLTEFAISSIRDTSGVNMELLGLRDANQPGVLEYQRRQSAMTTLARFFDALRFYRKRQGHTVLNMLRNHIAPTGRLVRLVREDQTQYVPLAMGDDVEKYDVIIDDAPSAPNEKEKAWSVIEAMMPILQGADLSLDDWADILEYSPLPSSFADKVREKAKKAKEQEGQPNPMEQLMQADAQASVQLKQAQAQKAAAEAQSKGGEAQMQQAEMAQRGQEIQADQVKTRIDLQSSMQDAQAAREKMEHDRFMAQSQERLAVIKLREAEISQRNTSN